MKIKDFINEMCKFTDIDEDNFLLTDILENAIDCAIDEMDYYETESKYALISPEWKEEYETYQSTLQDFSKMIKICKSLLIKLRHSKFNRFTLKEFKTQYPN